MKTETKSIQDVILKDLRTKHQPFNPPLISGPVTYMPIFVRNTLPVKAPGITSHKTSDGVRYRTMRGPYDHTNFTYTIIYEFNG